MTRKQQKPKMDARRWANSVDPLEMVCDLEDAGCYLEFEPFFMDCFNRIRHELINPDVRATPFTFGVDVDELTDAAQTAIDEINRRLTELDEDSDRVAVHDHMEQLKKFPSESGSLLPRL